MLFIADEVMTGWGRTGTLLACEQAGVVPDILCLSKGLTGGAVPLAVTMASEPIFEAHYRPTARDVLPLVQLHRQSDRLRRGQRQSGDLARGAGAGADRTIWRASRREWLEKLSHFCHFDNARQCGTIAAHRS